MENIKYVYDKDGIANAVENINGNDFRVRVETLIVNGDKVMINNTGVLN